jgi:5-methyltetrahydrofolate--homocysteine methyltransferase
MPQTHNDLRKALAQRVLIADGAMGTMLQAANPSLDDFQGFEGCNEVLNISRPDIVASVHSAYLEVGVDLVETNTFGANWANLLEYDIPERIYEYNLAAARIAKETANSFSTKDHPRYVIGSMGPGTKLPSLGHTTFANLRDTFQEQARGLIDGGADALLIETSQDLLQTKSAVIGAMRAKKALGIDIPVWAQVTVETTGTMLLGTEIGAALTALSPLGIEIIGLNCATGPLEMSEHLRYLSQNSKVALSAMPNAGLPVLTSDGAFYPLSAEELAEAHSQFVDDYGLSLIGGCCGTTPEHLKAVVDKLHGRSIPKRNINAEPSISSLYVSVPFRQENSYLAIGERTNATGSKAFRDALLADDFETCVDIAKEQIREGAHLLDLNIDYVGRDGVADMNKLSSLFATSSTLPIMLDSTEPDVLQAGLENFGGRAVVNSVNYEDGDGPTSRFQRTMRLVSEHGAAVVALTIDETGMARTCEHKVQVASRLIDDLCSNWAMKVEDVMVDTLTFPIVTGQEETRRDGLETLLAIEAISAKYPGVQTVLGLSNVSFGLNAAARQVLNSVFLAQAVSKGLTSAIVHPSKILPLSRIPKEQLDAALDLIYDKRKFDKDICTFDPLSNFLDLFENVDAQSTSKNRLADLLAMPLFERLSQRIIDGEKSGLEEDLAEAMSQKPALAIVNEDLLEGMKTVGERFGAGTMQLPFVLQSAEVMKYAVSVLEPHMEKSNEKGKGTLVLATVKGDVHDIGKNLVDIILTNNGYNVVNIGIKQPVNTIIDSALEHDADVIGMSGLLVKSTVIMKENLIELNTRKIAERFPVILGGAALTRTFVEDDLHAIYDGEVRYAKDAFEGLRLMDALMAVKRGVEGAKLPELKKRRIAAVSASDSDEVDEKRSEISTTNSVPATPFIGSRVVKGFPLNDFVSYLDERSLFLGQWGLKPSRSEDGASYDELVETEGKPRLRYWLDRITSEQILEPAVVYGYFPAFSRGNGIFVTDPKTNKQHTFSFPRQGRDRRLCLADFVKPEGENDFVALHVVTMGSKVSNVANELFKANDYRNYVELHGLSVALTEALAEYWHARVRQEIGISANDGASLPEILKQNYQGERFSFGYPACPELEHQTDLVELLDANRIGVEVSEELQLHPEQSTSAIIFHHPDAAYFNAQ